MPLAVAGAGRPFLGHSADARRVKIISIPANATSQLSLQSAARGFEHSMQAVSEASQCVQFEHMFRYREF